ncbi:MAG: response regulator transcription factor [Leptolyngbyaceae cyanobacterium RU_5_1]|nr:response regulator transcription factor [Leptolyngbyaceae cyanobacterium RU_5_1]
MKILVVEDDPELLEPLNTVLSQIGHVVDGVETAEVATWLLEQQEYDLLILDWMLPTGSGIDLCQHYRMIGKTAPVLMLTARDSTGDKVMGLDAGADDYLVKPVDMPELLARVRALGRRSHHWQDSIFRLGELSLDVSTLTVAYREQTVALSHRETQLLELFLRHPRQILTRDQIEQALWNWETEPGHNAITVQIRRLRQRLQVIGCDRWIETVYGAGYRFSEPSPKSCHA